MRKKTIQKKYFTLYATCLLSAIILVSLILFVKMYTENRDMIVRSTKNTIYFSDLNLSEKLKSVEARFGSVALAEQFMYAKNTKEYQALVDVMYAENNDVLSVFYMSEYDGNYSSGEPMGDIYERLSKIEKAKQSEEFRKYGRKWFWAKTANGYNAAVLYCQLVYVGDDYVRHALGDMLIYIDSGRINENYFRNVEENTGLCFVDSDGIIAVASNEADVGKPFDACFRVTDDKIFDSNGKGYFYFEEESSIGGWKNIAYYSYGTGYIKLRDRLAIYVIIVAVILIATVAIGYYFTGRLNRPLKELTGSLAEYVKLAGNAEEVQLKFDDDEIAQIESILKQLSKALESQIEQNYRYEIAAQNALIKSYESQMNPHFLYNTLQTVQMLNVLGKNDDINKILNYLAKLLRFNLTAESETTLGIEIENIENYFRILKYRFGDKFSYKILIDEDFMNLNVVKFMLQPFIENSVNHGFGPKTDLCEIVITAIRLGGDVAIVIKDNGTGISRDKLDKIKESLRTGEKKNTGIGITNVHERIRLVYGKKYGVDIFSRNNETQVLIHIPGSMQMGEKDV